jgi:hypothetical protein
MKKTKKTMFTAAVLSAACALSTGLKADESFKAADTSDQGNDETAFSANNLSAEEMRSPEPMYGPPSLSGDMDHDYDRDIADLIMMKECAIESQEGDWEHTYNWNGDLDYDSFVDGYDILKMQRYLMGIAEDPTEPLPDGTRLPAYPVFPSDPKTPEPVATVYGPPWAFDN